MESQKLKIELLPSVFVDRRGKFNQKKALKTAGLFAGVCYNKEGYSKIVEEPLEKTLKRAQNTLNSGHHSVYDHINVRLNLVNIPKILAMFLNNEKQYATSEKSSRYTKISKASTPVISDLEENLYNKWVEIFINKIKETYDNEFVNKKIKHMAQENARYLVTIFIPTTMIYSTSLRQINNIAAFCQRYIENHDIDSDFENKVSDSMLDFYYELLRLNLIDDKLSANDKNRSFSLIDDSISNKDEFFHNKRYTICYEATFANVAQAQRHRTIDYNIKLLNEKKFFVPPIIENDEVLKSEWLNDMKSVSSIHPQGELVLVEESGTYKNFILKCKERLCSCAQLEINNQTKEAMNRIIDFAKSTDNKELLDYLANYSLGARCTFKDYNCTNDCKFKEGKTLTRKI